MKKLVVLSLLCLALTGCGAKADAEPDIVESVVTQPEVSSEATVSDDVVIDDGFSVDTEVEVNYPLIDKDADIVLYDQSITLPITVGELKELGWEMTDAVYRNYNPMPAGYHDTDVRLYNDNFKGTSIEVDMYNETDAALDLDDCVVYKITTSTLPASVKGFTLGGELIGTAYYTDLQDGVCLFVDTENGVIETIGTCYVQEVAAKEDIDTKTLVFYDGYYTVTFGEPCEFDTSFWTLVDEDVAANTYTYTDGQFQVAVTQRGGGVVDAELSWYDAFVDTLPKADYIHAVDTHAAFCGLKLNSPYDRVLETLGTDYECDVVRSGCHTLSYYNAEEGYRYIITFDGLDNVSNIKVLEVE